MKIKVGISNHHVHLTKDDLFTLFGDVELENIRDLHQYGQFVSNLKVTVGYNDRYIENLKILGPERSYTQVELLKRDCEYLGIDCPIASSGELDNAGVIRIYNGDKFIERKAAIIANRHLHITKEDYEKYSFPEVVSLENKNHRIENVIVRAADNSYFEVHIDKEDAENLGIVSDEEFEIDFNL